jgi:outer membrane protein
MINFKWWIYLTFITGSGMIVTSVKAAIDPFHTEILTTPNPQTYWVKPANLTVGQSSAVLAAAVFPTKALTLTELTDFALQNSPDTRLAWYQAKAAAAQVGIATSAFLPQLDGGVAGQYTASVFAPPHTSQLTYGPNFSLNYLLLDFGNRANTLQAAEYAQISANLLQNNAIQQVILAVQRGYYQLLGQQALVDAYQENVQQAKTSLDAAQALRDNGLATIGDVYQAQASYAQANLNLQTAEGNYQTAIGQLAVVLGLPASTPIKLSPLQSPLQIQAIEQSVTQLLQMAESHRPDLLAAEANYRQSQAQLMAVKTSVLPNLSIEASAEPGGVFSNTSGTNLEATLTLSMPLFTGFSYTYNVRQAQAQVQAAQATRDQLNQQVQSQVWQNYFALRTAKENIATTALLLQSSTQAHAQALGQYKSGVGDILSVLTTQSTLASARVQHIQAELNWYVALAQLAASVGGLTSASPQDLSL